MIGPVLCLEWGLAGTAHRKCSATVKVVLEVMVVVRFREICALKIHFDNTLKKWLTLPVSAQFDMECVEPSETLGQNPVHTVPHDSIPFLKTQFEFCR